jgi:predicted nuclease of restriction endonuclease-like RecB superfamily
LGERWQAWQAMGHLLLELHGFEVSACLPPRQLREALFIAASASRGSPRPVVIETVAGQLGVPADRLQSDLYADAGSARLLRPAPVPLTTSELIERYNLALVQGLMLRAEALVVGLDGQLRPVLRWARLQRLLCSPERDRAGGTCLRISGPLSLFHHTLKYGRAMAAWLPALSRSRRWRMTARCVLKGRSFTLRASHTDPIGSTHAPPRRFDSALEERFFRDLARAAPGWEVLREAEVVQLGRRLLCADFTLVDRARGLRVPVEIVGFWTPEYLSSKLAALRQLPRERPWIVCIDETLAAGGRWLVDGPVFLFRRRIDAARFLTFLETRLGGRAEDGQPAAPG